MIHPRVDNAPRTVDEASPNLGQVKKLVKICCSEGIVPKKV